MLLKKVVYSLDMKVHMVEEQELQNIVKQEAVDTMSILMKMNTKQTLVRVLD